MYRLAMSLALLVAVAVAAGCGGSGDDSDSSPPAVAEARESAPSRDDAGRSAAEPNEKKETRGKSSEEDDDEPKTHDDSHEEQEDAFEKLSMKRKSALIEAVVRSALPRFGLSLADVEVSDGGRRATVVVAREGACNFVAKQEPNLVLAIEEGAPGLKSVRLEVAGSGQQLGYYVLGCRKPEIPSGAGRVVFEHSAVGGPYESKRFKIESRRWALEWVNEAASLAVIVVPVGGESKNEYFKPVGSRKREAGRYHYTGRGTFQIKANGAGGWRVRVKEIR